MPNAFSQPLEILNPPFQRLETLDLPAKTPEQITNPKNANPLVEGEWIVMVDGADTGLIKRAVGSNPLAHLYLGQVGRTDIQTTKKAPIALDRPLRIKTKIVAGTGLSVGSEVMVGNVTFDGLTRSGLVLATSTNYAQGYVVKKGTNTGDPDGSFWEILLHPQPRLVP